jgi:hypothetical protein
MMRFPAMTICSYVCQSLFWWSFQMLYDRCVFWNGFILDLAWEGLDGEAATEGSKEDQQCPFWCIIILVAVAWGSTRGSSWQHVLAERFDPRTSSATRGAASQEQGRTDPAPLQAWYKMKSGTSAFYFSLVTVHFAIALYHVMYTVILAAETKKYSCSGLVLN